MREAVHLARNSGIILGKEPVAMIEIPSMDGLHPPSLTVIDLPETGTIDTNLYVLLFIANVLPGFGIDLGENSIQRKAHVVLTGDMLDALLQSFPEMVDQIIGRVTVFASANALQTNRFLEKLNKLNRQIRKLLYLLDHRLLKDRMFHRLISRVQGCGRLLHHYACNLPDSSTRR